MNLYLIFILICAYILGGIGAIYLDYYFIGLSYIIIYVGAIAILFLFLIMMISEPLDTPNPSKNNLIYGLIWLNILIYI